jgi:hypothetical protein
VETKAHLCFLKKVGGRCGCAYGTKGAVDQKGLGTTDLDLKDLRWKDMDWSHRTSSELL